LFTYVKETVDPDDHVIMELQCMINFTHFPWTLLHIQESSVIKTTQF